MVQQPSTGVSAPMGQAPGGRPLMTRPYSYPQMLVPGAMQPGPYQHQAASGGLQGIPMNQQVMLQTSQPPAGSQQHHRATLPSAVGGQPATNPPQYLPQVSSVIDPSWLSQLSSLFM